MKIKGLMIGVAGACLLGAAGAAAQDTTGNTIGNPQLRDFQLTPKQTVVPARPDPQRPPVVAPQRPPVVAPPPPVTTGQPAAQPPRATPETRQAPPPAEGRRTPTTSAPEAAPQAAPPAAGEAQPQTAPPPAPIAEAPPVEELVAETPAAEENEGIGPWLYGLPLALLVLLGGFVLLRRRRQVEYGEPVREPQLVAAPPAPATPRPDPIPRPWLELELKTLRASFTEIEAVVQFELSIANVGGSPARNLRIDVKMINAGREQDNEISGFFRTAGRETTRLSLPGIAAGQDGVIKGEVGMPIDEMKALKLDGRMLFVPVIAVNALYDFGEGRSGQSSKSYVVGRELETSSEKMGAFRVDQGPRIWRTVGQRQHSLAKRV